MSKEVLGFVCSIMRIGKVKDDKQKLKVFDRNGVYLPAKKIGKVFKMASQKADKGIETVEKKEAEQTPVKAIKSFVKAESEPVPEMPKKSALASKYPRLTNIYHKLEK